MTTPRKAAKLRRQRRREKQQMENLARGAQQRAQAAQPNPGQQAGQGGGHEDPLGQVMAASGLQVRVVSAPGVDPTPKNATGATRVTRPGQGTGSVRVKRPGGNPQRRVQPAPAQVRPAGQARPHQAPTPQTNMYPQHRNVQQPQNQVRPSVAQADVSVLLTCYERSSLLRRQLTALAGQSMKPSNITVWVNSGEVPHDEQALKGGSVAVVRANTNFGPWIRFTMALELPSKYVCIMDDDTIPGPRWIEACIQRLEAAEQAGEDTFCIAAAGEVFRADDPTSVMPIGPDRYEVEEQEVDIGRQAWFFRRDLALLFTNYPRLGGRIGWGLHFAAALQAQGLYTVVLPYDRSNTEMWGMLEAPVADRSVTSKISMEAERGGPTLEGMEADLYQKYREAGWMPLCVLDSLPDEEAEEAEPGADAPVAKEA